MINNNLYKIRIYKNWSGKTCYFQNVDDEKIVGLYINEHDTRPLDILFDL